MARAKSSANSNRVLVTIPPGTFEMAVEYAEKENRTLANWVATVVREEIFRRQMAEMNHRNQDGNSDER